MRFLLFTLALLPVPALAQSAAVPQEDPTEAVTKLSRHIDEMRELLTSRTRSVRDAAIETALRDPSPTVRGMAISTALQRYDHLPFHFALPDGSAIQPEDLPPLTLERVKWDEEGRSFTAVGATGCGVYAVRAAGQVMGDTLKLQVNPVCLNPQVMGTVRGPLAGPGKPLHVQGCEAEMRPNAAHDELAGALRCPSLSTPLPVALPLG